MARIFRFRLSSLNQGQLNVLGLDYVTADDLPANGALVEIAKALGFADASGSLVTVGVTNTVYGTLQGVQGDFVTYTTLQGSAPYSPAALYDESFPTGSTGLREGPGVNPANVFMAVSIRSNRIKRDVRRGYKRIGGLFVSDIGPNSTLASVSVTEFQELAAQFSRNLPITVAGTPSTAVPVVLKTFPVQVDGKTVYRLDPDEEAERQASAVGIDYELQENLTTQSSRKKGRGA